MRRIPLTVQLLVALVAGLVLGLGVATSALGQRPGTETFIRFLEQVGTLWVNAIRMTVIPLVVAALIVSVSGAGDVRQVGRLGVRSLAVFLALLTASALVGVLLGAPLMTGLAPNEATIASLRALNATTGALAGAPTAPPTFGEWLLGLIPVNPVRAAADGAMLPLIVFAVGFGTALTAVAPDRRAAVVRVFDGIQAAALVLVRWILRAAPVGVFALALAVAARIGFDAIGALAGYVGIVAVLCIAFTAFVLYPVAVLVGKVPLRDFARAAWPAQGIAFSSRSSLAALPAMLEGARTLRLPDAATNFALPLAASVFRTGAGIGLTGGVVFIATLHGVDLSAATLASVALTVVLSSFAVPGIPGGFAVAMIPALMAAGVPVEGIGLLMGVDTIPDMFRTTTNVTGQMVAATVVARGEADPSPATA